MNWGWAKDFLAEYFENPEDLKHTNLNLNLCFAEESILKGLLLKVFSVCSNQSLTFREPLLEHKKM